jgi:site-specific DNA-methyltransferase (adenine-specific)
MSKGNNVLAEAQAVAEKCKTWADLSNALFDPVDGLVTRAFPDTSERRAFRKTKTYDALHALVERKMELTGVIEGSTPRKSGKFVVRLPRSLHAALEHEATEEGISLNQLVVAKLAIQLDSVLETRTARILRAFAEVREGFSADRVIADPKLDTKFLRRCRELGLTGTDYDLNWALMNARKSGDMSLLPKTKRYTVRQTDDFDYASELAARHIELAKGVSLDRIVCDPELAQEFDKYAEELAPGRSPLEYRWVALGLRKAGRLSKEAAKTIEVPELKPVNKIRRVDPAVLPESSGLYLFQSADQPVFLSQTDNLRQRIERHIKFGGTEGLPTWLWDGGALDLLVAEMPGVRKARRQQVEVLLMRELQPAMNFPRQAA